MRVVSVNIAAVRELALRDRVVRTGIFKLPTPGPHRVGRLGLASDAVVETRKAGKENHAVYAYPVAHYGYWAERLGVAPWRCGHLGENLTIEGLDERRVRIGDVLRCGASVLQVTLPRIPCRKLDARMGMRFARIFLASRRVGFYLRVLEEGDVEAGDSLAIIDSDPASPTVDEFVRVSELDYWDAEGLDELLGARGLPEFWAEKLRAKRERAGRATGWHGYRGLRVLERVEETPSVVSLHLACGRGKALPPFRAGQYLTLQLRLDADRLHRAYAISSAPSAPGYRLTVQRCAAARGAASLHLCDVLRKGDEVRAAAPRGNFGLDDGAEEHVFVAWGIGIAPIASMLHAWAESGGARPARLHYVGGGALMAELRSLAEMHPLEIASHESIRAAHIRRGRGAVYYLAGESGALDALEAELEASGVGSSQVRSERFGPRALSPT